MANITPDYIEQAAALAQQKPSYAADVHDAHVSNLALSKTGEDAVIRNGPHVAHYLSENERELNKILALPGREQGPAVDALAATLDRGSTNEDTDAYINSRKSTSLPARYAGRQDGN